MSVTVSGAKITRVLSGPRPERLRAEDPPLSRRAIEASLPSAARTWWSDGLDARPVSATRAGWATSLNAIPLASHPLLEPDVESGIRPTEGQGRRHLDHLAQDTEPAEPGTNALAAAFSSMTAVRRGSR